MRTPLAFLKRDLLIEASYGYAVVLHVGSIAFSAASYYFLARFVGTAAGPSMGTFEGDYFGFVLVGVALHEYLATALDAFSRNIRESQLMGTLEALLTTQTPLSTVILSSAAYPFLWTSLTVALYLGFGVVLFGLRIASGNWGAALLILSLAVLTFSGIGILSASFIVIFKRSSPIAWLFSGLSWLLGGVLYPVTVLPEPMQVVAALLPITHAIRGMRAALLQGAAWSEIGGSVLALALFAGLLLPSSLLTFAYATRRARIDGTLAQY